MSIPDFCLACSRQLAPEPVADARPLAEIYAQAAAQERNLPTVAVALGIAWCAGAIGLGVYTAVTLWSWVP